MPLSHSQKKIIKKNINSKSLGELSNELGVPSSEILSYLKKNWRKDKYQKYIDSQKDLDEFDNSKEAKNSDLGNNAFGEFLKNDKAVIVFFIGLVSMLYIWTLGFDFVSDDKRLILQNIKLKDISYVFRQPVYFAALIFHWVIANTIGLNEPWPYRLLNIMFHTGSTIFIFLIFNRLYNKRLLSFIVAVIFAAHPILIESVTWIAGYSSSQFTFFLLLSFWLYLESQIKNVKYYYFSLIAMVLTISSSHRAVSAFLIFPLYELVYGNIRNNYKKLIPIIVIGTVGVIMIAAGFGSRVESLQVDYGQNDTARPSPLVQIPVSLTQYVYLIFVPLKLSLYQTELSMGRVQYIIRILAVLVGFVVFIFSYVKYRGSKSLAIKFWKTSPNKVFNNIYAYVFFWISIYIIGLLPSLNPFGVSWIVAERYAYLGSIGVFAIIGMIFYKLALRENIRIAVLGLFAFLILLLSIRTITRNRDWQNEDTLWIATAKTSPSGHNIHNNLGDVYARSGDLQKAEQEFALAIKIKPDYAEAYHNLANTQELMAKEFIAKGDKQKSQEYITNAIQNYQNGYTYNPNLWQSYLGLGSLYYQLEDYPNALKYMTEALNRNPNDTKIQMNMALIYYRLGDNNQSREYISRVLQKDPANLNAQSLLNEMDK